MEIYTYNCFFEDDVITVTFWTNSLAASGPNGGDYQREGLDSID